MAASTGVAFPGGDENEAQHHSAPPVNPFVDPEQFDGGREEAAAGDTCHVHFDGYLYCRTRPCTFHRADVSFAIVIITVIVIVIINNNNDISVLRSLRFL